MASIHRYFVTGLFKRCSVVWGCQEKTCKGRSTPSYGGVHAEHSQLLPPLLQARGIRGLHVVVYPWSLHDDQHTRPHVGNHYRRANQQIYIAESALVYCATQDKKNEDAWKSKRAWISQIRTINQNAHPRPGMSVFRSTSHNGETQFFAMDYQDLFRV
ncbi:MAG: hypothetical protein J3Q66DRAFT_357330, partial [Benniella sp.]